MLKTLQNALKVKDLRKRMFFTVLMLIVVRIGSQLPVPGANPDYFKNFFQQHQGDAFNLLNSFTGGSFESFSILALSITPYITSSIIMQLMTIAIPKLEEMQKDGEEGRKKIVEYTRYLTVALALIESIAMSVGFGRQGLLEQFNWHSVLVVVFTLTAGSAFLMWLGERITDKGIGNGISLILLVNILSRIPDDIKTIYDKFIAPSSVAAGVVIAVIIIAILIAIVAFTILLNSAARKIPVQYSQKMQGRRLIGGQSSHIPLKVNTAGVIPVIFASSLMSTPVIISQFFNIDYSTIGGKVLMLLNSGSWFRPDRPWYTFGALIYIAFIIVFAYFYTSITFNPLEIANNIKKQGGFIPGIRPGKPTSDYLNKILNYIVLIGAIGLTIVAVIPIVLSGIFNITRISFIGTSLIIIVGVIQETLKQIEIKIVAREYDSIF